MDGVNSLKILEQNVGVAPYPEFGCQEFYKGSMCWTSQENAFASNVQKNGPFDIIFLEEVMDERDCEKGEIKSSHILTCQKYPEQQQISRLINSDYTKICDGHRSCVAINTEFANVSSCLPVSSTCMDSLQYQTMKVCTNSQVDVSGISYIDLQPYELKGETLRVILYHPIGYQGCFCADCYMEYVQIMERLLEEEKKVLIAGDFNFDILRLGKVAGMKVFEGYYQNITQSFHIKFFNEYYKSKPELTIATELGQATLDFVGSNYYKSGKCKNMNSMEERMDYPVLTFDHRGQICELSTTTSERHNFELNEPSISSHDDDYGNRRRSRKYTSSKISKDDLIDSLVRYDGIYVKELYNSTRMHVLGSDFWFNVSDVWVSQPYGLPILTQYATSTHSIVLSIESELIIRLNGTILLNVYNKVFKKRWEEGTLLAELVLKKENSNFQVCTTFCGDTFEPLCFKNNPKKPSEFCPANATCPQKYQKLNDYLQITNLLFQFDGDLSSIVVENVESELFKEIVDFVFKEMKGSMFSEIESLVTSYVKGRVFQVPI